MDTGTLQTLDAGTVHGFTEEVVVESSCLVSKKLLKVTQELERFVVTKFFCRDKLLQSALVRKGCASQKLIHKCVIRV